VRRRLVLVALATTAMVAIAFLLPLGALVRSVARNQALTDAQRDGRRVADALTIGASGPQLAAVATDVSTQRPGEQVQVFLMDGSVVGDGRPADSAVELARARGESFDTSAPGGADVLTPVVRAGGTDVVRVSVSRSLLERGVWRSWLVLGAVALALVVVAVLVADRLAASIVRPVRALAGTTRKLAQGQTDARVRPAGPAEVAEVGVAVNTLADRIDGLLAAERELVADLSHRLRTPLAALRLDAETIQDPEVATRVARDVDSLEAAVNELIAEARAPRRDSPVGVDLVATTRERAAFWAALAEDQGRQWQVELPNISIEVPLRPRELGAALDALFGNVFTHTPEGTAAAVAVRATNGSVSVVLDDDGPGFPDDDVLHRGVSRGESSGLGLDIVRRTVTEAGGTVSVTNRPSGGAHVRLELPIAHSSR
jgi:signal transduction histidine kinase